MLRAKTLVPAIIGLVVLVVGVVFGVILVQRQQSANVEAQPQFQPVQVEVSNITDSSFVVSWVTQAPATGLVAYGEDSETEFLARDKRDEFDQKLGQYTTHWVKVVGLKPSKTYYFYLQSGGAKYDKGGQLYSTVTGKALTLTEGVTAFGKVSNNDGSGADGAIVLVSAEGMAGQSAITDLQGNWSINFANARTSDSNSAFKVNGDVILDMRIQGGGKGNSTVRLRGNQLTPVPDVTLGKTFDFISLATPTKTPGQEEQLESQFVFAPELGAQGSVTPQGITIFNPQENEALATGQPLFIGTAPINTSLNLVIDDKSKNEISGTTKSDGRGNWQWSSDKSMKDGEHTITVSYTQQGVEYQLAREFTVLGSATGPAFEASPSATRAPSPSPTRTATLSPTKAPTASPTKAPTATGTVAPTASPTKAPTATGTTAPTATPTKGLTPSPTVIAAVSPTPTRTPTPTVTTRPSGTPTPTITEGSTTTTPTPTSAQLPSAGATGPTLALASAGLVIMVLAALLLL